MQLTRAVAAVMDNGSLSLWLADLILANFEICKYQRSGEGEKGERRGGEGRYPHYS